MSWRMRYRVPGTEGSIKPGVMSESLSWAVQQVHQGSPSSSEMAAGEMYGRRGGSCAGAVRRRFGCGGGAWFGGLRRRGCGALVMPRVRETGVEGCGSWNRLRGVGSVAGRGCALYPSELEVWSVGGWWWCPASAACGLAGPFNSLFVVRAVLLGWADLCGLLVCVGR